MNTRAIDAIRDAAAKVTDTLAAIGERAGANTVSIGHLSATVYPWQKQAPEPTKTCPQCGATAPPRT